MEVFIPIYHVVFCFLIDVYVLFSMFSIVQRCLCMLLDVLFWGLKMHFSCADCFLGVAQLYSCVVSVHTLDTSLWWWRLGLQPWRVDLCCATVWHTDKMPLGCRISEKTTVLVDLMPVMSHLIIFLQYYIKKLIVLSLSLSVGLGTSHKVYPCSWLAICRRRRPSCRGTLPAERSTSWTNCWTAQTNTACSV